MKTRVHPWWDNWELERVGRSLIAASELLGRDGRPSPTNIDPTTQANLVQALQTVSVWKIRSEQGRIPHSIETTFLLAQLLYRDAQSSTSPTVHSPSTTELRLAYASVLVRGVNGLADVMQQQRAFAGSISSLCEQMGLPGWIVDLRHEAAHNDLPSLASLRLAAKTFLGYLEERFWTPLLNVKAEQRDKAAQMLLKYKAASKGALLADETENPRDEALQEENEESNDSDSESEDDKMEFEEGYGLWNDSIGTNQNRFAALFEDTKPKKSKPEKKEPVTKDPPPPEKPRKIPLSQYAKDYVKNTPIDVGHQVALSFLVWGGIGDAPEGRGVLVPGSVPSFPENAEGVEKIRRRYRPLIFTLCGSWPGFQHALLVHLVEFVLALSGKASEQGQTSLDAGAERKLFFLVSWVKFLLSREFQARANASLALFDDKTDLSRKLASKWSDAERSFMESRAPYAILEEIFPMKSLFKRCTDQDTPALYSVNKTIADLLDSTIINDMDRSTILPSETDGTTVGPAVTEEPSKVSKNRQLSLAEMESLLSKHTVDQEQPIKTGSEASGPEGKSDSRLPDESDKAVINGENSLLKSSCKRKVATWVKCEDWEACAIGSIPGYAV